VFLFKNAALLLGLGCDLLTRLASLFYEDAVGGPAGRALPTR